jgi:hypothetical protein
MKIRQLLAKLRLRSLEGEGKRPVGNVDAMASMAGQSHSTLDSTNGVARMAPPNWIPSQQDDRPRH